MRNGGGRVPDSPSGLQLRNQGSAIFGAQNSNSARNINNCRSGSQRGSRNESPGVRDSLNGGRLNNDTAQ